MELKLISLNQDSLLTLLKGIKLYLDSDSRYDDIFSSWLIAHTDRYTVLHYVRGHNIKSFSLDFKDSNIVDIIFTPKRFYFFTHKDGVVTYRMGNNYSKLTDLEFLLRMYFD